MGIGPITYNGGVHNTGVQDYFTPVTPAEPHVTGAAASSVFGTGAYLSRPGANVVFKTNNFKTNNAFKPERGVAAGHQNVDHQNVADTMGFAAGAAVVAAGLIAFAKSCVTVAGGVAASVLLVTKQALDAARPTTATPDL